MTPYLALQVLTGVNHQMAVRRGGSFGRVIGVRTAPVSSGASEGAAA
jgi:hypothetical protein